MISNAPVNAAQSDRAGLPTLPWVTWFVQLVAALNSILFTAWKAWTPTISGSGSMTVTSSTITEATYLQVGANVSFHCKFQVTFGGTGAAWGTATAPVSQKGDWQGITAYVTGSGMAWQPVLGLAQGSEIFFYAPNGGNWPVGSALTLALDGTYRCL